MHILTLATVFNRLPKTVACLNSLKASLTHLDVDNLGGDLFGETASYMKENWEKIYIIEWAITITILIINVLGINMAADDGKKAIFKNIAIYDELRHVMFLIPMIYYISTAQQLLLLSP